MADKKVNAAPHLAESQGGSVCNCPFCAMPRILSLAIEKGAFGDPTPAAMPAPKSAKKISMATAGRQLSALDTLLKRGIISPEKHAAEIVALKAKLR